jgi:YD repeat-containing protein
VTFTLPEGSYRFRADKADGASGSTHFWSGDVNHCTVPGCGSAVVTTTISIVVTVEDSGGGPQAGLDVYAFDGTTYTGYNRTTDASGLVTFTLPVGSYRFRADKNGTQYWSGPANHCPVPGCTQATVTIASPDVTVAVRDTDGVPEQGLKVYVFDETTYTGYNGTTNISGTTTFTLPAGDYRFRADKADGASGSTQFWSSDTNHCTVPGCGSAVVTTTVPVVVGVEDTDGSPEQDLKVYAFDGTTYTGYNETTDASGLVTMTLPMGDYRFRADKADGASGSTQFWSGDVNHCTVPGCTTAVVTTTIPVVVTVEDGGGNPEAGLKVYAFDNTTYTGHNGTTDASGLVTMTLPMGDYRFRADKADGASGSIQFWSSDVNHCPVPGCTAVTITVGTQAMRAPAEGLALVLEEPFASDETDLFPDPSYRPPGQAALLRGLPQAPLAESGQMVTVTRVITQVYDPLGRLVSSDYSTGESFTYAYDAGRPFRSPSNRRVFTSTTPLSGTLVTTYTFDAANRLTARVVSDGRSYTYEWSQRGQLLAENTQGVDVRTFTYDGAGRLVEATVFTLTTRFTYNGLGARTSVEVVGHGTTTVTLDYAAGNRILAETTITGTTMYLYGRDCLGQYDGTDDWLYYLNDGDGLVRQSTDAEGEIVSAWLFDPDGTVLEGPEGPVSHLVCGGVYDWSTGLVYKDGRYFDPMLGIWLALAPLIVVQSWRRRRERRGGLWAVMLALFLVGMGGILAGCVGGGTPTPEEIATKVCTTEQPPTPSCECDCLPTTGAEPSYEPEKWNDGDMYQDTNNCYSYAADDFSPHFSEGSPTPGAAAGITAPFPLPISCYQVMMRASFDGFEGFENFDDGQGGYSACDCDEPCQSGRYKVMVFVSKEPLSMHGASIGDYHFYRQDQGGCWSHKRGKGTSAATRVTDVDASGNRIGDPRYANRSYPEANYSEFCGCLCVVQGTKTKVPIPIPSNP